MDSLLFVTSSWGPRYGGINAFNADLVPAVATAVAGQLKVVCVVLDATVADIETTAALGIELISLPGNGAEMLVPGRASELVARVVGHRVSWWIGHDLVSGGVCVEAARLTDSRAAVIQHTNYPAYGPLKGALGTKIADRQLGDLATLERADAVFGVGPKLAAAAADRLRRRGDAVHELVPGLAAIDPYPTSPGAFSVITFGRLDPVNDRIKQGRLAVQSFARLVREAHDFIGPDPRMTVIGVGSGGDQGAAEERGLRQLASHEAGRVVMVNGLPYTEMRAALFELLADSSVCLMLSTHEGFGLTGWEAIAAEVPLVLSKNTGLYEFLDRLGGSALGCVRAVDVRGTPDDLVPAKQDVKSVVAALRDVASRADRAKRDARLLKAQLAGCTWSATVTALLSGLGIEVEAVAPGRSSKAHDALPPSNLEPSTETFVGRAGYRERVADLVLGGERRLVTIVGVPGAGKTRLAREVSRTVLEEFDDHVYLVDLTTVADPELVIATITRALSLKASHPLLRALKEFFRDRRALILLDNFEQVLPAARRVTELLSAIPGLVVLATSRSVMGVSGEEAIELELPPIEEAVQLFHARTGDRYAGPEFEEGVRALCRRLDCLPLALELVAPRSKVYPPAELFELINDSILLVRGTRRDGDDRFDTLEAAFDWSYDLLSEDTQDVFCRLSVFEGGWTRPDAAAVIGPKVLVLDLADHLVVLTENHLINTSLATPQMARFTMLPSMREYAKARLEGRHPEITAELRARHAAYFLELVTTRWAEGEGFAHDEAFTQLALQHANISAAIDHFVARRDWQRALRMAHGMGPFWWSRDYTEGFRQTETVLALAVPQDAGSQDLRLRAEVLINAGRVAIRQCELGIASTRLGEAMRLGRGLGAREIETEALAGLALADMDRGDYISAKDRFELCLTLLPSAVRGKDMDKPETRRRADCLDGLAIISAEAKDWDEAHRQFRAARDLYASIDDQHNVIWVENGLAQLALLEDHADQALQHASTAIAFGRRHEDPGLILWAANYLGLAHVRRGEIESARAFLIESMSRSVLLGDVRPRILAIEGLALLAFNLGKHDLSATLIAAMDVARRMYDLKRNRAETALIAEVVGGETPPDSQTWAEPPPTDHVPDLDEATELARQV